MILAVNNCLSYGGKAAHKTESHGYSCEIGTGITDIVDLYINASVFCNVKLFRYERLCAERLLENWWETIVTCV